MITLTSYLLVLRLRFELHFIKITEQQFDREKNDISSCDILSKIYIHVHRLSGKNMLI